MLTFGEEVSRLLAEKGMSQTELAAACGTTRAFVSQLVKGKRSRLGADILYLICESLDVRCDHFRPYFDREIKGK